MIKKIFAALVVALLLASCGGIAAGMANRYFIEEKPEVYVDKQMKKFSYLDLTDEQKKSIENIYKDELTELKANARLEKSKEISNGKSLDNMQYIDLKTELRVRNILTPSQIIESDSYKYSMLEKTENIRKRRKKLEKKGYKFEEI